MKKTIMSVLIVLLLSFSFIGCGEEEDPAALSVEAEDRLKAMDINPADIIVPADCVFDRFVPINNPSNKEIYIIWKGASSSKYQSYYNTWTARPVRALNPVGDIGNFTNRVPGADAITTYYFTEGGTDSTLGISVSDESIVLYCRVDY